MAKSKKNTEKTSKMTFVMNKDKETKGAVRYSDPDGTHNLYFRKDELMEEFGEFPESLTVTVTC